MSTRIHNAYRISGSAPWDVVWEIADRAKANVKTILHDIVLGYVTMIITDPSEFERQHDLKGDHRWQMFRNSADPENVYMSTIVSIAWKMLRDQYRKQSLSMERNAFDFDVSLTIYPHKGRLYIRTSADSLCSRVFDFLDKHERVHDFSWDSQCGKPDDVSWSSWNGRERVWNSIARPDYTLKGAYVDVCSVKEIDGFNPFLDAKFINKVRKFIK